MKLELNQMEHLMWRFENYIHQVVRFVVVVGVTDVFESKNVYFF